MKNCIFALMALLVFASTALAQGPAKIPVQNSAPVQLFTPDAQYSKTVTLAGTKPTGSATLTAGQSAFYISCYNTADATAAAGVKAYLNGASTHPVLLGTGTVPMGVNNTGKGTKTSSIGFSVISSASERAVTCEVWGQ